MSNQVVEGIVAIVVGLFVTACVAATLAWATILPTLGLLWCFGVLK